VWRQSDFLCSDAINVKPIAAKSQVIDDSLLLLDRGEDSVGDATSIPFDQSGEATLGEEEKSIRSCPLAKL
jgi:hypothetical protein